MRRVRVPLAYGVLSTVFAVVTSSLVPGRTPEALYAPFVLITLLLGLAASDGRTSAGVVFAVGMAWLTVGTGRVGATPGDTFVVWYLLGSYALPWYVTGRIGGHVKPRHAAAVAVAGVGVGLMWVSWPLWGPISNIDPTFALSVHPLFVLNGAFPDTGIWSESAWVYRHSPLGQDVPYVLPRSAWPAVRMHLGIGLGLLLPIAARASVNIIRHRRGRRRRIAASA